MSWAEYRGTEVQVAGSAPESARFGVVVARAVVPQDAASSDVGRALADVGDDVDVLVLRHLAGHRTAPAALAAGDRLVLPAGTLTYWEVAVGGIALGLSASGLTVAPAAPGDPAAPEVVAEVVRDSFTGYGNHYSLDPLLDDGLALDGYVEWATTAARERPADVLVLSHAGRPVGVATLAWDEEAGDLEILLAGLVGDAQGHGWYGSLLSGVDAEAGRRGARRVVISTQSHNTRVQRAWARAGFRPFAAVETVHLVHPRHRASLAAT